VAAERIAKEWAVMVADWSVLTDRLSTPRHRCIRPVASGPTKESMPWVGLRPRVAAPFLATSRPEATHGVLRLMVGVAAEVTGVSDVASRFAALFI
jgi:hypothetical protein